MYFKFNNIFIRIYNFLGNNVVVLAYVINTMREKYIGLQNTIEYIRYQNTYGTRIYTMATGFRNLRIPYKIKLNIISNN